MSLNTAIYCSIDTRLTRNDPRDSHPFSLPSMGFYSRLWSAHSTALTIRPE